LPKEFSEKLTADKSTTPIGIAKIDVITIPIKIAPLTFLITKILVMTNPMTPNKIAGLLKLANAGTIPPLVTTFVATPSSTVEDTIELASFSSIDEKW